MRRIAIRIDDVCAGMDWERFCRFADILDRQKLSPLIGVVPECLDEKLNAGEGRNKVFDDPLRFAQWLKERQERGWVVAMHGCHHRYVSRHGGLFPLNSYSEFAGLPYADQLQKIEKGKKALAGLGICSDIFMAPAHSYDKNTLRALRECGFRYVTDGYGKAPYEREGLVFLPISFLRSRELRGNGGICSFVEHPAMMDEKAFAAYERLLSERRQQFVDYGRLLEEKALPRGAAANIGEWLMAKTKHIAGRIM